MLEFLDYMRKGEFRISVCSSCSKKVWPPSKYCSVCLSKTALIKIEGVGELIEFTQSYMRYSEGIFGIIDISGIRVVGSIDARSLWPGMKVKMIKCGVSTDGTVFYQFQPS